MTLRGPSRCVPDWLTVDASGGRSGGGAELARVMSGVTFDTSNYLTAHPDVNDFFTSLKGQTRDQINQNVQNYLDANPSVRTDLQAIRQPSADFRTRCGAPATP